MALQHDGIKDLFLISSMDIYIFKGGALVVMELEPHKHLLFGKDALFEVVPNQCLFAGAFHVCFFILPVPLGKVNIF